MVMKTNNKKPATNGMHITVMKAVKKKPAVNEKKPAVNKKSPAINQMTKCYCTIAEAHCEGNYSTKQNPTMLVELRDTVAWLAGELAYSGTCIGGSGRIIKHKDGGLTICRKRKYDLMARQTGDDCIGTETGDGKQYGGFISAKVTSIAPGTLFQARKIDPGDGSMSRCPPCSSTGEVAPPRTVVAKNGDIICTFKIDGFYTNRTQVTVHLMRPMLTTQGFIQHSLQTQAMLSETIEEIERSSCTYPSQL